MKTGVARKLINPENVKECLLALAEEKQPAFV
jgi:hypothetical protein